MLSLPYYLSSTIQMRMRANNSSERRFKVGDRVLLKNTKRNRQSEPLFDSPGVIESVLDGSFTVLLERGGANRRFTATKPSRPLTQ